eukprot:361525-Chlamydomonas_euryale.AAC.7
MDSLVSSRPPSPSLAHLPPPHGLYDLPTDALSAVARRLSPRELSELRLASCGMAEALRGADGLWLGRLAAMSKPHACRQGPDPGHGQKVAEPGEVSRKRTPMTCQGMRGCRQARQSSCCPLGGHTSRQHGVLLCDSGHSHAHP